MSRPRASSRARQRAWARGLGLLAALLALAGCGDLDTTYGTANGVSINGRRVLDKAWDEAFDAGREARLGPKLDDCDLILHFAEDDGLPDAPACEFLRGWLQGHHERQAVLLLKDGTITPWLLHQWAQEARKNGQDDPATAPAMDALAIRLDARAYEEEKLEPAAKAPGQHCPLFSTLDASSAPAQTSEGMISGGAPQGLVLHRALDVPAPPAPSDVETMPESASPASADDSTDEDEDESAKPSPPHVLERIDGRALVVSWEIGHKGGRLVVVASTAPLLDGAQVDPAARLLLARLTTDISARRSAPLRAVWVRRLEVSDGDDDPPAQNILLKLLATPPFCYAIWQFVLLGGLWLGLRAFWLGRVSAPRDERHERFGRHVAALAYHLRRAGARDATAAAIARHHGRPAPPPAMDDEAARAAVAPLFPQPQPPPDREPT
jgi:hypothetical protein